METMQKRERVKLLRRLFILLQIFFIMSPFFLLKAESLRLRIGVYQNPPKVFINEKGDPEGFFVDLINEIAREHGWDLEFVPGTWSEGLARLTRGEIDLMTDVAYSVERARKWHYHEVPVLSDWFQVYVRKDADIKSVADLEKKRIAVLAGSVQQDIFSKYMRDFGFSCDIIPFESYPESLQMLQKGNVDAVIVNRYYGVRYLAQYDIDETGIIFHPTRLHFAASPSLEEGILQAVDDSLRRMTTDHSSAYYQSLGKWFGEEKLSRAPSWMLPALLILSAGALLMIVMVSFLRLQVKRRTRHILKINESLKKEIAIRRESEHRFQELFENSPLAYFIIMPGKGLIQKVNLAARELLGYTEVELREKSFNSLFPDEAHGAKAARILFDRFTRERKVISGEVKMSRSDGEAIWVILSVAGIYDEDGSLYEVRAMVNDISDRKVLEEQLIRTQKMEALGVLAGGIAHDFNNILTAIIGYTEVVMEKTRANPIIYDKLEEVYKAGMHARNLVKQILTFSRETQGEVQPVQVKKVVQEALKLLKASLPRSVVIRAEMNSSAFVLAEPTQIHQIIMNLCLNGVQALTGEKGRVAVLLEDVLFEEEKSLSLNETLSPGPYIHLKVSDTGTGIPPENIEKIFDPFFTTKAPGKGTGMGLSVVQSIVKKLQGGIEARSRTAEGTEFSVYFPLYETRGADEGTEEREMFRGREAILLVEDNEAIIELVKHNLEEAGYYVTAMRDGLEALDYLQVNRESIDMVISNLTMPKISGTALAKELGRCGIMVPLLIITGHGGEILEQAKNNPHITDVIHKPFTRNELLSIVRKVLDQAYK